MANTAVEPSPFYNHFNHYNQYLSDLSLYENWLSNKKYRGLSPKAKEVLFIDYSTKLIAKTQIDLILNRKEEISKNAAQLKKLQTLFARLNLEDEALIKKAGIEDFNSLDNPLALLGATTLPTSSALATAAQTNLVKDFISYLNRIRLSIMGYRMLIDFFLKNQNIQAVSQVVATLNGHASYGFYYARGFLELAKLFKHSFITDHEILEKNNIKAAEKLNLQLGLRYGILINDSLWGIINFLTYHILIGSGAPGYLGNVLTIVLLFSDFLVSLFNIYLAQKKFNTFEAQLKDKLNANKEITNEEKQKILKEFKDLHEKNMRNLRWSAIFTGSFCLGFIVLLNFLIPGPNLSVFMPAHLFLAGALFIVALQFIDVIREVVIKFKDAGDSKHLKHIALLEGISRLITQATIPALMLSTSLLMSALPALPAWFFIGSMLATSVVLINTISSFTQYLVLNKEIAHFENEKIKLESTETRTSEQTEDISDLDAKIQEKIESRALATEKLQDNLVYFIGTSSTLSIAGLVLASSAAAFPFLAIPVATLLVSLVIKLMMNAKKDCHDRLPLQVPSTPEYAP